MGFLSAYEGVRRIDVDKERGYWIDLYEHVSQGAKEAAERAATKTRVVQGVSNVEPDVAAFRLYLVLGHIKDWNLDNDNGSKWPINLATVKLLPGDVFEELWAVVSELTNPPSKAERKRFPEPDNGGDQIGWTGAGEPAFVPDGTAVLAEDRGEPQDAVEAPGA